MIGIFASKLFFMLAFKKIILAVSFVFICPMAWAQTPQKQQAVSNRPKLVVGVVVDQMRWDYLYRFQSQYGANGFKKLMNRGFNCQNTLITHLPTYTAVGHSGVYTGSVPSITGIIGNNWYDRATRQNVYCSEDSTVQTIGSNSKAGKMSPRNMWTNTITDELRLSSNFSSKVIGIALKDRGAIFPAGHSANAAYWYDDGIGKWISSSYYMDSLPQWVNAFNQQQIPSSWMKGVWKTVLPIEQYMQSSKDDVAYEETIPGEKTTTFPYLLSEIKEKPLAAFKFTPFANTYSFEFAKTAIQQEKLGKGSATDFLTLSLSATDYIGHAFGPNSIEIQDTYLRLDQDIAEFIQFLDNQYGANNYLLFLTADHGAAHVPNFLSDHSMPGGTFSLRSLTAAINERVEKQFGIKKVIAAAQNDQLYLDESAIQQHNTLRDSVIEAILQTCKINPLVVNAFDIRKLYQQNIPEPIRTMLTNGLNTQRSGDIQLICKPGYIESDKNKGTTHGSWNPYDAHIPLLWYGWGIKTGQTFRQTHMTDIAATLAALLHIQMPNGCVGEVITELVK